VAVVSSAILGRGDCEHVILNIVLERSNPNLRNKGKAGIKSGEIEEPRQYIRELEEASSEKAKAPSPFLWLRVMTEISRLITNEDDFESGTQFRPLA